LVDVTQDTTVHDRLADGLSWAPQRSVFIRRTLILGVATFLFLSILGSALWYFIQEAVPFDVPVFWVAPTALLMTVGFLFDDALRWRAARLDRWQINGGYLIHDGQDGSARIPLTEIDQAFRRLGSNVVVQLRSGKRIVLRYLPYPAETAEQINAAKPK
jgi:hypothetical protein